MPVVPGGDALVAVRPDEDAGRLGVAPPDEDLLGEDKGRQRNQEAAESSVEIINTTRSRL